MTATLVGCGGTTTTQDAPAADASVDSPPVFAEAGSDPSDGPPREVSIETHGVGLVYLANNSEGNGATIDAVFTSSVNTGCFVPTPIGQCVVHRCPLITEPFGRNAGLLSVGSPRVSASMQPTDEGGTYGIHYALPGAEPFTPADEITVSASGKEVHAFRGTVVFPRSLTLVPPDAADNLIVKPNVDITLHWTGVASDPVLVQFQAPMLGDWLLMDCLFDGASGQGVITAASLAEFNSLRVLNPGFVVALRIAAQRWGSVDAGGWRVQLRATGTGVLTQALFRE